jgi:hypothetical protein
LDTTEARRLLLDRLKKYRQAPYRELAERVGHHETGEIVANGKTYQFEIQFYWDDAPNGVVRVFGSIDDRGWRAYVPLTECLLVAPDGSVS